jgi:predicted molibdopterin-dependent oxidoreductase YjgC
VYNLDEFQASLKDFGPQQVERLTGVASGALQQASQILAQAQHPIILYGMNWVRGAGANASEQSLEAMANLALLLGGIEAGFIAGDNNTLGAMEMGMVPDLYPGGQPFKDNKTRSRLASFWGGKLSPVEGLDLDHMVVAGQEGALKAMWIMGADPARDCRRAGDALGRIPFLVVQDLFMSDTASLAEVVLPAASFAETDGGFINLTGRLQAVHAAMRPPGRARPDWWIIAELAMRMVDGKRKRAWDFSGPADVLAEITKVIRGYRGVDYAKMAESGWQRPAPPTKARRSFVLVEPDAADPEPGYPLTLVTGRLLYDRGTLLRRSERIQNLVPEAFVMIHPSDAEKLGLADGDNASVVSAVGRLGLSVKLSEEIVPGVAFAPLNLSEAPLSVLFTDRWSLPRVRIVK